jgi:hypothetical protein
MSKGDNGAEFLRMLRSYASATDLPQQKELVVDLSSCHTYQQTLARQREDLVQKVYSRFRYY